MKITFDEWILTQSDLKKISLANFLTANEKKIIANCISEGKSLRSIWLYFKSCNRMPFSRQGFTAWCKKNFNIQKKKKNVSLPNKINNDFRIDLPTDDSNSGFRMDLPITDNANENSEKKTKKVQVWHSPYKHLSDDEFKAVMKEKSKALDKQGTEGVFVYDRSQKY